MNESYSPYGIGDIVQRLRAMGKENLFISNNIEVEETATIYKILDLILGQRVNNKQLCLQTIDNTFIPTQLSDFTADTEQKKIIISNSPFRINNSFDTYNASVLGNPKGGYIYYLTEAQVEFYCNGFVGGFTEPTTITENGQTYNLYRSNQKLTNKVTIETKKLVIKEE